MRFFQLTFETRLSLGDPGEREEAVLEVARQKRTVLQIFGRLSLGVQYALYPLDDGVAMSEEESEEFDVCLERYLARARAGWAIFGRKKRMKGQVLKPSADHDVSHACLDLARLAGRIQVNRDRLSVPSRPHL